MFFNMLSCYEFGLFFSYRGSVFPLMVKSLIIYVLFLSMLSVTFIQWFHFRLMSLLLLLLLLLMLSCNVILSFFNVYPPPLHILFCHTCIHHLKIYFNRVLFWCFNFVRWYIVSQCFLSMLWRISPPLSFMNVWHDYSIFFKDYSSR